MNTNRRVAAFAAFAIIILLAAGAAFAQVSDWKDIKYPPLHSMKIQQPKRIALDNGMVIFLQEDHELPLVNGRAVIRGGAREEPAAKAGVVEVYGEVWRTGGTKTKTGDQFDDYLEARAAKVETSGDIDSTEISFDALKGDFDDVFSVFIDLLQNPELREDKIALAKNQINTGIARRNDNPMQIASREATKLTYGASSPYARAPEYYTVTAVTRDDLINWHETYVHPNNIIIGVTGDFDSKKMEARLRKAFSSWKRGPQFKAATIEFPETKPGLYFIAKDDVNQSNIRMTHLGIRRDNPDYYAVQVMNEVLGGGFSARLFTNVRSKKGLAYFVGGGVGNAYDHPGEFAIGMGTKSETTAAAIDALNEELDNLQKTPATAEELQKAKESILNSFVFANDSKEKILSQQMALEFYGYPLDLIQRYPGEIEKVTAEDVARAAHKYVHKDKVALLVVGKAADFDRPLSSFGPVNTIDITIPEEDPAKAAAQPKPAAQATMGAEAQALVAKMTEGLGGAAKLASITGTRQTGTMNAKTPQGDMALEMESIAIFPDRAIQKMSTPMGDMVVVMAPDASFMKSPMGVRDLPASQRENMAKELKRSPIYILKNSANFTFTVAGTEKVGDVDAKIVDVSGEGLDARWSVDPSNGRIVRTSSKTMGMAGPGTQVVDYSDWKDVDGIPVAYKRTITMNGEDNGSFVLKTFEVNPKVDPAMFEKPATPPPPK